MILKAGWSCGLPEEAVVGTDPGGAVVDDGGRDGGGGVEGDWNGMRVDWVSKVSNLPWLRMICWVFAQVMVHKN